MTKVITIYNRTPTQDYYLLDQFHDSLARFHAPATVLGLGKHWGGLMTKPKHLKRYLESGECKADHIILPDAYDVVFQDSPDEIIEKFKSFNCDFLAGAEENCFPEAGMACDFPYTESPYKYLNSGAIISTPDAILQVLRSMDPESIEDDHRKEDGTMHEPNDQYYYQLEFIKQPVNMKLDYNCFIVQNLCNVQESDLIFDTSRIVNRITGMMPSIFHFNGGSKTSGIAAPILKKLGLHK